LGQTINRGYKWPSNIQNQNFAFGVSSIPSESFSKEVWAYFVLGESAKDVVYNHPGIFDDEKTRQLYLKSHLNYEAG